MDVSGVSTGTAAGAETTRTSIRYPPSPSVSYSPNASFATSTRDSPSRWSTSRAAAQSSFLAPPSFVRHDEEIHQIVNDIRAVHQETEDIVNAVSGKLNKVNNVQMLFFPLVAGVLLVQFGLIARSKPTTANDTQLIVREACRNDERATKPALEAAQPVPDATSSKSVALDRLVSSDDYVICKLGADDSGVQCQRIYEDGSVKPMDERLLNSLINKNGAAKASAMDYYFPGVLLFLLMFIAFGRRASTRRASVRLPRFGRMHKRAPEDENGDESPSETDDSLDEEESFPLEATESEVKHDHIDLPVNGQDIAPEGICNGDFSRNEGDL